MRASITVRLVVCFAALANLPDSRAIEPCEVARLTGDPAGLSCFGVSADISGDYLVVGDSCDGTLASVAGAAYVFKRQAQSWVRQQKIFGSDTNFQDTFGYSVGIDGDRVVVGAPHKDPAGGDLGKVYVFQRNGANWIQQQQLVSSGSAMHDYFGYSVAIDGDVIAIGAPRQQNGSGRVYVFRWNGSAWVEEAVLVGSDTLEWDEFGTALSLNQGRLLVGAMWDDNGTGSAYVFREDGVTWTEEAKLMASDRAERDFFGGAVSLSGDYLVVGAKSDDDAGPSSGSAYILHRAGQNWIQEEKLTAADAQGGDSFGSSVRVHGYRLFVGAPFDGLGSAYFLMRTGNGWVQEAKLVPSEAPIGQFGTAIALDGDHVVVTTTVVHIYSFGPPCIPAMSFSGLCILAGVLVIAGIALLRRGKLNVTHYDDS